MQQKQKKRDAEDLKDHIHSSILKSICVSESNRFNMLKFVKSKTNLALNQIDKSQSDE